MAASDEQFIPRALADHLGPLMRSDYPESEIDIGLSVPQRIAEGEKQMNTSHAAYVCGKRRPLRYQTIGDALTETSCTATARRSSSAPEHPHDLGRPRRSRDRTRPRLPRSGLAPGDRVGIWSPNNAEWVLTQLATARAADPRMRQSRLSNLGIGIALNKVGCRALVTAERLKTSDYLAMLDELAPELATSTPASCAARLPDLRWIVTRARWQPGCVRFEDVRARGEAAIRRA